jgi:RNA polymerase sigma-70 factor (ECF subfamily)
MDPFPHNTDENGLLNRLNNSDEAAFTEIYNLYWKRLFFLAAQKLQNLSEAEEIVQDIFLDLWKRRKVFDISVGLSAYLSVCVKYKVINLLARRNQHLRYSQHAFSLSTIADLSTQHTLQFEELQEQLIKETAKLPEKCRMVFQLSREQGYSQKQIAEQLKISEKTVESHISRALHSLRTGLSHLLTLLV